MTTIQKRLDNLERGRPSSGDECQCKPGPWVECLLGEDDPEPAPICPTCGKYRELRTLHLVEEIVDARPGEGARDD